MNSGLHFYMTFSMSFALPDFNLYYGPAATLDTGLLLIKIRGIH